MRMPTDPITQNIANILGCSPKTLFTSLAPSDYHPGRPVAYPTLLTRTFDTRTRQRVATVIQVPEGMDPVRTAQEFMASIDPAN